MRRAAFGVRSDIAIMVAASLSMLCAATSVITAARALTRSEVLAIADEEAQRAGYNIEQWGVSVDAYNSMWTRYAEAVKTSSKSDIIRQIEARLNGRSIWAVSYRSPLSYAAKTAGLFVFIDQNSGEVIGSFNDSKWQEGFVEPLRTES